MVYNKILIYASLVLILIISNIMTVPTNNKPDKDHVQEVRQILLRYLNQLAMSKREPEDVSVESTTHAPLRSIKCGKVWCKRGGRCEDKRCRYDNDTSDESIEKCGDIYCEKGAKCEYDSQLKEWECAK